MLVDIVPGIPQGKALDITQAGPVCGYSTRVVGTNGYEETAGSSIAVITSGMPRKPGMSRDELLATNAKIVQAVVKELIARSPEVILILVTNPLDAMVHVARRVSGLPKSKVLGMAGVLDTARLRSFVAEELNVPGTDVHAMVLGGHGDTMVPLVRHTTVSGKPITTGCRPSALPRSSSGRRTGAPRSSVCSRPAARFTRLPRRRSTWWKRS